MSVAASPLPPPAEDNPPAQAPGAPPAEERFILLPEAAAKGHALEFRTARDVVLHIKPSLAHRALVVNAHQAGRWATERRLPVPPPLLGEPLDLLLREEDGQALLSAAGQALSFPLARPLAGARLFLPPSIIRWAEDPAAEVLHGQIARADLQHAAISVQRRGTAAPGRSALLLRAGGRVLHRLDLPPPEPCGQATQASFRLLHRPDAMIFEGMPIELLAETGAGTRILDRTVVESRLLGVVEHASAGLVRGWARNPALPHQPLLLDIYLNGRLQGIARADAPHAGRGPAEGRCGFCFALRETAAPHRAPELRVSVRIHDTDLELTHSPWWIRRPATGTDALTPLQPGNGAP
jgi:hypothetical protein